ncbi:putative bifunctional dTTP/UTP pyrophosphatase/methyltransferase protein isoform X9 [Callithrix jacchus]
MDEVTQERTGECSQRHASCSSCALRSVFSGSVVNPPDPFLLLQGLRFEVVPSRFKEKLDKASFATPYGYAMETAKQKALEVANRMYQKDLRAPDMVIGADTIVFHFRKTADFCEWFSEVSRPDSHGGNQLPPFLSQTVGRLILEKPVDKQDAYRMLSQLSGREHSVCTGVAIVQCSSQDNKLDTRVSEFYEETMVKFSELSEDLLWEYIHSGEPMDKAGGYGIQALGGMLVESVHGDFLNVVGFPLNHFCKQLLQLYDPPRPEDLQRVKHGSIPAVDTFEDLSDVDEGGPAPTRRDKAEAGVARDATAEAEGNRTCETLPPFPTRLLELINGFKTSKALFTACKLKVFDLLKDEAPQKAAGIASKVDASVCGTERLLDFCACLGFLEKSEQGCTGALAQELVRENPHLQVTVFDLPETIELAAHFQPAGPQAAQVQFAAGDFFRDRLPPADLYILCQIIHDWPDDRVHEILSRVAQSCKPGAGLLLVETLLDEEKREARVALLQSLNMLVQLGGRERSPGEYQCLLEQHGFCQVQVAHLGGILDAMLATRVGP